MKSASQTVNPDAEKHHSDRIFHLLRRRLTAWPRPGFVETMENGRILWKEGTPYSENYQDVYYSVEGGMRKQSMFLFRETIFLQHLSAARFFRWEKQALGRD